MDKLYLNPYIFFIILEGKLISWDYINHQQFEIEVKYLNRLLEISQCKVAKSELDEELEAAGLILRYEIHDDWGWDCLSKIFHFGTKIKNEDLSDVCINDPASFVSEYIELSENKFSSFPSINIEKEGEVIRLPPPDTAKLAEIDFLSVLKKRKTCRTFNKAPISLDKLSTLLYVVFGDFHPIQDEYNKFLVQKIGLRKTSPAGGGLHSAEAYLLAQNISGLNPGIYHYQAHNHVMTLINSGDFSEELSGIFCGQYFVKDISLGIFITSRFEKLWHKYPHSRAYRVALLDIGHLSQTFQLVATSLDLNPWLSGAFVESEISKLLRLDKQSEQPMFFVGAGIGEWSSFDPLTKKLLLENSHV